MSENIQTAAPSTSSAQARGAEKVVWWVVFGVLTLSILGMVGFWN